MNCHRRLACYVLILGVEVLSFLRVVPDNLRMKSFSSIVSAKEFFSYSLYIHVFRMRIWNMGIKFKIHGTG